MAAWGTWGGDAARGLAVKKMSIASTLLLIACSQNVPPQTLTCPDIVAGCQLDKTISVRFSKTPAVMEKFSLDAQASQQVEIFASFQMQGMDMGLNRYRLLWNGTGWHADVMLPACIRGRHDWVLRLEAGGKVYEVPFVSR